LHGLRFCLALLELDNEEARYCEGSAVELSVNTNASTISWILNGMVVSQDANFDANAPGEYTIEVQSDEGCSVTSIISVTESPNPVINIDNQSLCPGETTMVGVDDNFENYSWTGLMSTGNMATVDFQAFEMITTETYSLEVTDSEGCVGQASFDVTYFPPINASVASSSETICLGESITLMSEGGLYYNWTDSDNSLSATDIANPVATPVEDAIYTLQVSDDCPNNVADFSVEVFVNPLPIADAGPDTCAIINIPLELEASGGLDYQWNNTDLIEGSAQVSNPEVLIETDTSFIVTVTDENGCMSTDEVNVCIILNPGEVLEAITIMTPNGDGKNDELIFRGLEAFPENTLTIFNRWGNVIFKRRGYQTDEIRWRGTRDGVDLAPDTYFYILEFEGQKIKKSLTILRD